VLVIHHPKGDVKKATFGAAAGSNTQPVTISGSTYGAGTFYQVNWQFGIVEPGSSGSGLITAAPDLRVRATLTGGRGSCTDSTRVAYYSKLSNMYPTLGSYLTTPITSSPTPPPTPIAPVVGLWWNPNESGSGYALDYKHGVLVVTVYSYAANGAPQWYLAAGPVNGNVFTATLDKYASGQCISCVYRGASSVGNDGTIRITFTSPTSATLQLPGGRVTTIQPQAF
jgi:hypothetical protein